MPRLSQPRSRNEMAVNWLVPDPAAGDAWNAANDADSMHRGADRRSRADWWLPQTNIHYTTTVTWVL